MRALSYRIIFRLLCRYRLYRLYARDTGRYEVVQVVGGENGAHREQSVLGVATKRVDMKENKFAL